eukprot:SAG31_NODE_7217_length_1752_cov_12.118572_2_plen_258_part_00
MRTRMAHCELSEPERQAVLQHSLLGVLESLGGGVSQAAALEVLINVTRRDMLLLAAVTAQVSSLRSIVALLLTPVGAVATDCLGRKPCMVAGRLFGGSGGGGILWRLYLLFWPRKTRASYVAAQVFLSVVSCASGASLAATASLDDRFGKRADLGAVVTARMQFWSSAIGLVSPLLGVLIDRRSHRLSLIVSLGCGLLCVPLVGVVMEETRPTSCGTLGPSSWRSTLMRLRPSNPVRVELGNQMFFFILTAVQHDFQ